MSASYKEGAEAKGFAEFPNLGRMLLMSLISEVFPVSDRRHVVVTPMMLLMSHMLLGTKLRNAVDVRRGLFLANLFTKVLRLSPLTKDILFLLHRPPSPFLS